MTTIKYNNLTAKINSFGAELTSFTADDKEYIWEANPKYWGKSSPLLFPTIGFLKDGKTIINGKEYSIPKHGFARDSMFEVEIISKSSAKFTLCENEEIFKMYPFKFELAVTYTVSNNGLTIDYSVKNRSETSMPFCIGLHPAFKCPIDNDEAFSEYNILFHKSETLNSPQIDPISGVINLSKRVLYLNEQTILPLNYEMFAKDAVIFEQINSRLLCLSNGENTVNITFDGFTSLGLWAPINAPFICIEPWCGMNDRTGENGILADKFGAVILKSNKSKKFQLNVQV